MNRVARHVRVGDMALNAFDDEAPAHAATAAVLDHVASLLHRGGFANDAVIELLATFHQLFANQGRSVFGGTLLVTGNEHRDGQGRCRLSNPKLSDRYHDRSQRSHHVAGATAI